MPSQGTWIITIKYWAFQTTLLRQGRARIVNAKRRAMTHGQIFGQLQAGEPPSGLLARGVLGKSILDARCCPFQVPLAGQSPTIGRTSNTSALTCINTDLS